MITPAESGRSNLFLVGLMAGTAIGAGLALVFAPRMASELHERATDLGQAASRGYQRISTRIADAVDEVTERQAVRDDAADAIGRGARQVEQFADAAKSSPGGWRS
jgi:gas vesicle protein